MGKERARGSPQRGRNIAPRRSSAPFRGLSNVAGFPRLTPWGDLFRPQYYWVIKEHFGVELFCGITPLCARPTREALRGIYRGPGKRRGARRPAHAFEELLQGTAVAW